MSDSRALLVQGEARAPRHDSYARHTRASRPAATASITPARRTPASPTRAGSRWWEAALRERFDEINERLAAQGIPTISLADREHVERYGLEDLAGTRGAEPG